MSVKVAINGFGRIGRNTLRAAIREGIYEKIDYVAINDPGLKPEDPKPILIMLASEKSSLFGFASSLVYSPVPSRLLYSTPWLLSLLAQNYSLTLGCLP